MQLSGLSIKSAQDRKWERRGEGKGMDFTSALPEGIVSDILYLTSPRDACRSSAISKGFKSVADSDAVWDRFLPSDHAAILWRSVSPVPSSTKKQLYSRLADCKIEAQLLSPKTTYVVFLVFQMRRSNNGFDYLPLHAFVSFVGERGDRDKDAIIHETEMNIVYLKWGLSSVEMRASTRRLPQKRLDKWMEVELAEFFIGKGDSGEVVMGLMAGEQGRRKSCIIIEGIENGRYTVKSGYKTANGLLGSNGEDGSNIEGLLEYVDSINQAFCLEVYPRILGSLLR
ncbi:hypothetical protein RHSIM_Rhsim02G0054800 [Rhododendron simsii]|uniref:F-box domain-containing protein n=1 Tax=Rhododendron simsii TaxID=118357 RepID=A0A834H8Q1_RHOSS|nr:hypothetical protein RHSIM_Rhsim02G0054800 [Rhododendron simsii]